MPGELDIRKIKTDLDTFLNESSGGSIKSLGEPGRLTWPTYALPSLTQ